MIPNPLQDDGMHENLDLEVKDYDLLERMHKFGGWKCDQEHHFRVGWEAAMLYYREVLIRGAKRRSKA